MLKLRKLECFPASGWAVRVGTGQTSRRNKDSGTDLRYRGSPPARGRDWEMVHMDQGVVPGRERKKGSLQMEDASIEKMGELQIPASSTW